MQIIEKFKSIKLIYKIIIITAICLFFMLIISIVWYKSAMVLDKNNTEKKEITIKIGSTSDDIAKILYENNLISSRLAFKLFIKINHISGLKAGTYVFSASMSIGEISTAIKDGLLLSNTHIKITFLEGKNIIDYAKLISKNTTNTEEDVYNLLSSKTYITSLIDKYWFLNEHILNNDIYYPLEGYLFPDTYMFENKDVSVEEIFSKLLDKMNEVLNNYNVQISNSKYNIHELLTIASVVEMEGASKDDKKDIAAVFYNRLNQNISLGSDVTTYYAFKIAIGSRDLFVSELNTYNQYNTRGPNMAGKLPVGPISSVSIASIEASINPTNVSYLYFVADKNGTIYFSNTYAEHIKKTNELKESGLWFEFDE